MSKLRSEQTLRALCGRVADVAGDWAELGVHRGTTLAVLAEFAEGRTLWAVDSFAGLPAPTARDGELAALYPAGKFADTSVDLVRRRLLPAERERVRVVEGWIPACLTEVEAGALGFLHLDLDLYRSTLSALKWGWPLLSVGGCIAVHDVFEGRDYGATAALQEFAEAAEDGSWSLDLVPDTSHGVLWRLA